MKDLFHKQYKNIFLVLGYIIIAILVYGYWMHVEFDTWYITLIAIIAVIAIGSVIGYFYIKNELLKEENIEKKQ